jgi:hypothetical protein
MDGDLYLDKTVKYGFDFTNITALEIDLRITGNNMQLSDFIYSTDFSVNTIGLCVGLRITSCQGVKLNAVFKDYYGRGIESIGSWQFNWGTIYGRVVGQAIFIKNPTGQVRSGIGSVGSFHGEEVAGSYFNGTDISLEYYENYIAKSTQAHGVVFDTCSSLWVNKLLVGYYSSDYLIKMINCSGYKMLSLFAYGQWEFGGDETNSSDGVLINKCINGYININTGACKNALTINGLETTIMVWNDSMSKNLGSISAITGFPIKACELKYTTKGRFGTGLNITNTSTDNQTIDGLTLIAYSTDRNPSCTDQYDLHVLDTTADVTLNGRIDFVDLPITNNITISDAHISGITYPANNGTNGAWIAWTPTLTWGSSTPIGITTLAKYKKIGKIVWFKLRISATDGNNATSLSATLPIAPKINNFLEVLPFWELINGSAGQIQMQIRDDGSHNDISSYYFITASAGATLVVTLSGFYEIN